MELQKGTCKHILLTSWCFIAWCPRVAGFSGERPLLSHMWPRGGIASRALGKEIIPSQPEHLAPPNTRSMHIAWPQELSSSPCELLWRRPRTWTVAGASCTAHACARILSCHLQAASDQGYLHGCQHSPRVWEMSLSYNCPFWCLNGNLKTLQRAWFWFASPLCPIQRCLETSKNCMCHILAWNPQVLHFPALTVLTSPSLLCTPETHTFLEITLGLCFFILMWLINYALQIFKQLMFISLSIDSYLTWKTYFPLSEFKAKFKTKPSDMRWFTSLCQK